MKNRVKLNKIPRDSQISWKREFSLLLCSFLARGFVNDVPKIIGRGFSNCVFVFNKREVIFYRSKIEEEKFAEFVGKRCIRDEKYAMKISERLESLTDLVKTFISKNRALSKENIRAFVNYLNEYLPYHLAVYWAGDYIAHNSTNKKILQRLERAWKYNELTYPIVDLWIKKQKKLKDETRDSLNSYISSEKRRSRGTKAIFALPKSVLFLNYKESESLIKELKQIEDNLKEKDSGVSIGSRIIKEIIKRLPHESAQYSVRDITLLTCSIFTESHIVSFKKIFGVNFYINFWYKRKDGQIVFYRSGSEYDAFAKKVGVRCLKDANFTKEVTNILVRMTDFINLFLKENNTLNKLLPRRHEFFNTYRDFFAYHQVVYWAGEYLTKARIENKKQKESASGTVEILGRAYKYNEKVVPDVEGYFIKLGIGNFVYSEIDKNMLKNKKRITERRSILLLGKEMRVLSSFEADKIGKAIREDYEEYLKTIKEVKGLGVSKGIVTGKVRLVLDLSKLQNCQEGDVLVTTMTRPQFNNSIRNVKAIVTDEGSMLCHASMLAREFNIPCVVGTKNATKLLKDGDSVEVDADEGVVKLLKRG
ncbi:MAG: PEP-utilizing enzyme [Patescibacteria group bacterium]